MHYVPSVKDFFRDFKEFAVKGNMIDMAIGIIIGTGFSKIVNSLVKDIILPSFGIMVGDIDLTRYQKVIRPAILDEGGNVIRPEVVMGYGNFLQVTLDFVIVALCIFTVIRLINTLKRDAEDEKNPKVPTPRDIQLLSEIRDLLKERPRA